MAVTAHISETVSAGQLRAFIERIERVEEEIKAANGDKSGIYKEARGCGFDVKAIRQCVAARKLDSAEREERTAIFELYWSALTGSVHVHTPARENIEKFPPHDPETGEITDTQEQPETATQSRPACPRSHTPPAARGVDESAAPHSPSATPRADAVAAAPRPQAATATLSETDDFDPSKLAFLSRDHTPKPIGDKPNCLKLKSGHCKIGFATSALCADCNDARMKVRA